jgi:hemerythrin-like domain-containing protein
VELLRHFEREHELIDRVAGSLYRWAEENGDPEDAQAFARFLTVYSAGFHHAREDDLLVPVLVRELEVAKERGPIMVIQQEHQELERLARELPQGGGPETARRLARILWEHIDKENTVLFPEAQERLRRAGVLEIPDRPMTPEEEAARALGEELVRRYPPLEDPDHVRGEGCIICSAYAETCRGIEAEWWNQWEWEDHLGHSHEG